MKIIFMGTPDFALPSLRLLLNSKAHEVVAVFSQAPKASGRGMSVSKSPVHKLAEEFGVLVRTPSTLRSEESLSLIKSIEADIIVVVAYGFIIPSQVLMFPKFGCLNIHPSKLPKYRGAAPLQRTIINGDKETAVCIMQMDDGLDTGDIILQKDLVLPERVNLQQLHDLCANIGGDLLMEVLAKIDTLPRIKQSEDGVVYAHKLTKEESIIDWKNDAFVLDCKVRGMNPWPGVFCKLGDKVLKIIEADYSSNKHHYIPGALLSEQFDVACGSGILHVKKVQPSGKGIMLAPDYLRGVFPVKNFDFLQNNIVLS